MPAGHADWEDEVSRCYPFHPQLISLAEQEWAKLSGFQKVRSTIRIFAATVYTLSQRAEAGEWAPLLIGPGDLPLSQDRVREAIIGSGLIADPRTQSNYRSLASADIVSGDDQTGSARVLDKERTASLFAAVNPRAAERGATCLFLCSVVGSRGGGRQGASEPELKAAMFVPSANFGLADADSVLNDLKDVDGGGLASVEVIPGKGGQPPRLFMSTRQTLNMLVRAARGSITDDERDAEVAKAAERLTVDRSVQGTHVRHGRPERVPRAKSWKRQASTTPARPGWSCSTHGSSPSSTASTRKPERPFAQRWGSETTSSPSSGRRRPSTPSSTPSAAPSHEVRPSPTWRGIRVSDMTDVTGRP